MTQIVTARRGGLNVLTLSEVLRLLQPAYWRRPHDPGLGQLDRRDGHAEDAVEAVATAMAFAGDDHVSLDPARPWLRERFQQGRDGTMQFQLESGM
jgi:hypothetical protein